MRKKEITAKYSRLLDPHAATFTGFEFAKILSRESVERALKDFLKKTREAQSLTVAIIKAEWGEGKTDAFERYIRPETENQGDVAYLVSTSSIVGKLSIASILFPMSPPESVTLLAVILYSIRDELKLKKDSRYMLFPEESKLADPLQYIEQTLRNHMKEENRKRRMYIFIDEFEEILLKPVEIQTKFLSGIKELINGQLGIIHKGGEFEGCIHIIIACTPYAYNRLKEDASIKEIFGSITSRIGPNVIELPQIPKKEALDFLISIIYYCYEGKLPSVFPIKSSGILNGICTISQRNLRPLIQLLIDLLVSAATNGNLYVIDYDLFFNSLKKKEISIFGETTTCIDNDLWMKIENTLYNVKKDVKCFELFKLLAGELKPFSAEEIRERLGIHEEEVHNLVEIINQELSKIGISRAVSRFEPLKEGKDINDLFNHLKPTSGQIISLYGSIPLSCFEDEIIHYEIEGDHLKPVAVFPKENDEFVKMFEAHENAKVNEEDADFLRRKIKDLLDFTAKSRRFMLSKELISQLYPSPLVTQLDFILERQKRMQFWRDALKDFSDRKVELRDGLIEVINNSEKFKISGFSSRVTLKYIPRSGVEKDLETLIYTSTSGINMNDVLKIKDDLKKERIDLVLLFYTGLIDEEASKELENMPKVLPIPVKTIRAQQLIALSLARRFDPKIINENLLRAKLDQIFYEIDFERLFSNWVDRCRKEGVLVDDLIKTFGEDDKSLAQYMTYYIETIKRNFTLEDVFQEVKKLKSFRLYGGREVSFDPKDIDADRFDKFESSIENYHFDLLKNSFIEESGGTITILDGPVEQKILDILKTNNKRNIDVIKREFIIFSQNKEILEQVYLPILELKGYVRIDEDKNEVYLINRQDILYEATKALEECLSDLNMKKNQPWWSFAHICISKERESKVIFLEEFYDYICSLKNRINDPEIKYHEGLSRRLAKKIIALISYYNNSIKPIIDRAYQYGNELRRKILEELNDANSSLNTILNEYNKYCDKPYQLNDIKEYALLKEEFDVLQKIFEKMYSREEIEDEVETLDRLYRLKGKYEGRPRYFYFRVSEKEASFFNYKIYVIERKIDVFKNNCCRIKNKCSNIGNVIESIKKVSNKIKGKILTLNIPSEIALSCTLLSILKDLQTKLRPFKAEFFVTLSLDDIEQFFRKVYESLNEESSKIETFVSYLNDIYTKEIYIIRTKNIVDEKKEKLKNFFENFDEEIEEISKISHKVNEVEGEYKKEIEEVKSKESLKIDEIINLAREISEKLSELKREITDAFKEIDALCDRKIEEITKYQYGVSKFLEITKEVDISIIDMKEALNSIIDEAKKALENLSQGKLVKITWKQIKEDLEYLRNKLLEYMKSKKILSEEEFETLFLIIEISSRSKVLESQYLNTIVAEKMKKSLDEAKNIIESLVDKNLLRKTYSLPI